MALEGRFAIFIILGVSENSGVFHAKSSILIGFSIIKPSILGYPYFWKHPYMIHELREEMGRDSSWTHVLVWHRLGIGNQARLNMTDWSHVLPLDLLWQNQPFM